MIRKMLFATDGSAAAARAAELAASLAIRYGATLTVLHAFQPIPVMLGEPNYSHALDRALEGAMTLLAEAERHLREMGAQQVETEFIEGPPADVILGVIETRKPDLVIIGSRGLGTWQGAFLGSVSMAVTQRAECPVLVVK